MMSLKEYLTRYFSGQAAGIEDGGHPWDWISHTVIGIIIWIPFWLLGEPLMGMFTGSAVFWGREQWTAERRERDWRTWIMGKWSFDNHIDFWSTALPLAFLTYLDILYGS